VYLNLSNYYEVLSDVYIIKNNYKIFSDVRINIYKCFKPENGINSIRIFILNGNIFKIYE